MAIEITSGAVVYRKNNGEIEYLLLESQNKGHFWGFPKGHVEGNETLEETAKREIKEETQLVPDAVRNGNRVRSFCPYRSIALVMHMAESASKGATPTTVFS